MTEKLIEPTKGTFISLSQETYYDFSICQPVPSEYVIWKYTVEATDEEIINYAAQSPTFDFLNEPEEDIYCLDDGYTRERDE